MISQSVCRSSCQHFDIPTNTSGHEAGFNLCFYDRKRSGPSCHLPACYFGFHFCDDLQPVPVSCWIACVFLLISSGSLPVFSVMHVVNIPAYGLLTSFLIKVENFKPVAKGQSFNETPSLTFAVISSGSFLTHSYSVQSLPNSDYLDAYPSHDIISGTNISVFITKRYL